MVFIAKCTHIINIVEEMYNTDKHKIISYCQDKFIEVDTEDEVKQIEVIERTMVCLNLQKMRLKDIAQD